MLNYSVFWAEQKNNLKEGIKICEKGLEASMDKIEDLAEDDLKNEARAMLDTIKDAIRMWETTIEEAK